MRKRNAPQQMPPLRVGRNCLLAAQSDVCLPCATDTSQILHIYERQLEGVQLKSYVRTGRGPVTLTLQRGVTGTARHSVNITCRGVTSPARHAARSHSFVYISTS